MGKWHPVLSGFDPARRPEAVGRSLVSHFRRKDRKGRFLASSLQTDRPRSRCFFKISLLAEAGSRAQRHRVGPADRPPSRALPRLPLSPRVSRAKALPPEQVEPIGLRPSSRAITSADLPLSSRDRFAFKGLIESTTCFNRCWVHELTGSLFTHFSVRQFEATSMSIRLIRTKLIEQVFRVNSQEVIERTERLAFAQEGTEILHSFCLLGFLSFLLLNLLFCSLWGESNGFFSSLFLEL